MSLFSTKNRHKINAFAVPSDMCGRVVSVKQWELEPYCSGLRLENGGGKCKRRLLKKKKKLYCKLKYKCRE